MGMFGAGFGGKLLRGLAAGSDRYLANQGSPGALARMNAPQELEIARIRAQAQNEEPVVIRTLRAAGIDPQSPQGVEIIRNNLNRPNFFQVGSPEAGYTIGAMGGAYGGVPGMTPGINPSAGPQTKVINGVTYYNVNGSWYDNPEGR